VFPPKTHIACSFVVASKTLQNTTVPYVDSAHSNRISKSFVFTLHTSQKPAGFFVYIYFKNHLISVHTLQRASEVLMGCASFSVSRGIGCVSSPPIVYVKIRLHLYSTSHGNNAISVNTSSSELLYVMVEL
jgi:hypothetical protein